MGRFGLRQPAARPSGAPELLSRQIAVGDPDPGRSAAASGPAAGLPVARIVSGGQTGVDRAALDAAVELGIPYGGWCPAGGLAEDLDTPPGLLDPYPGLRETPSADYSQRTEWNVRDSDATLILLPDGVSSPGTVLTGDLAERMGRPHLRIDPFGAGASAAVERFIERSRPGLVLNVAGPRQSNAAGIYDAARRLLVTALGRSR